MVQEAEAGGARPNWEQFNTHWWSKQKSKRATDSCWPRAIDEQQQQQQVQVAGPEISREAGQVQVAPRR